VQTECQPERQPLTGTNTNPDPIIGRRLFTDGIVRPAFLDDAGHQYVIDTDGHTRVYGTWPRPVDEADEPLVVPAGRRPSP
jgi:hypothetical protein